MAPQLFRIHEVAARTGLSRSLHPGLSKRRRWSPSRTMPRPRPYVCFQGAVSLRTRTTCDASYATASRHTLRVCCGSGRSAARRGGRRVAQARAGALPTAGNDQRPTQRDAATGAAGHHRGAAAARRGRLRGPGRLRQDDGDAGARGSDHSRPRVLRAPSAAGRARALHHGGGQPRDAGRAALARVRGAEPDRGGARCRVRALPHPRLHHERGPPRVSGSGCDRRRAADRRGLCRRGPKRRSGKRRSWIRSTATCSGSWSAGCGTPGKRWERKARAADAAAWSSGCSGAPQRLPRAS